MREKRHSRGIDSLICWWMASSLEVWDLKASSSTRPKNTPVIWILEHTT
jgi:hypothetical protein